MVAGASGNDMPENNFPFNLVLTVTKREIKVLINFRITLLL